MKSLALIIASLILAGAVANADLTDWTLPPSQAYLQNYSVLQTMTAPNTNVISLTNSIDTDLYHTVFVYCSTNLNGLQCAVDLGLDSTNFALGTTNTVEITNGYASFKTAFVEKDGFIRVRLFGTNVVGAVNYLGGR